MGGLDVCVWRRRLRTVSRWLRTPNVGRWGCGVGVGMGFKAWVWGRGGDEGPAQLLMPLGVRAVPARATPLVVVHDDPLAHTPSIDAGA